MTDQPNTDAADLTADEVLDRKMLDAMTPGAIVELDPDEADKLGAFHEDALTEAEALESVADLLEAPER